MKLSPVNITFGTTSRFYKNENRKEVGTNTCMFRDDVDWDILARFEIEHFKNKDRVNIVQFASSDGSEAYTKIISLMENGQGEDIEKFFPIKGYDIDEEIYKAASSGLINLVDKDHARAERAKVELDKYFTSSSEKLTIKNDNAFHFFNIPVGTYGVSEELKKRAEFHNEDMFQVLSRLADDSNTILMCRNVLFYMYMEDCKKFLNMASQKLKTGSLMVLGKFDTDLESIIRQVESLDFKQIMKNVFQKL